MTVTYGAMHCINRSEYYIKCSKLSIELIKKAINDNNLPSRTHLLNHAMKSPFVFLYNIYDIFMNTVDYLTLELNTKRILSKVKTTNTLRLSMRSLVLNLNEFLLKICGVAIAMFNIKKGCEILIKAEKQNKNSQKIWRDVFAIFSNNDRNQEKKTYFNSFYVLLEKIPSTAIDCLGYNHALYLNNTSKRVDEQQEEELIHKIFTKIIEAIHLMDVDKSSKFLKKIIISHPNRKPHFRTPYIEHFFDFSQDLSTKNPNECELTQIWINAISKRKIDEINILFTHLYFNLEYELMYNKKLVLRKGVKDNISQLFVIFNSRKFGSVVYPCFRECFSRDSEKLTLGPPKHNPQLNS